ncbi:MAG: NAD-dependent epimerase/dehydratase family protein, partial [Deltaproteobacteria bacterium]|nr:NAD-dependent epimerase/dehydratase family protein [Deltaproteobacteria bacterium]
MKVVIIGHTGFIGKNIFQFLESTKEYDLIGMSTDEIDLTAENSHEALLKELSLDCIVIMCAGVKKQLGDDLNSFEKNTTIVNNFIRAVSKVHPKKIIFLSSASVYGEDVAYHGKISEETPIQPRTYYGIAKYTAERLLEKNCADTQTQLVILRPPLTYGKDDLSRGYGPTGFTYKATNNEEIILWGDGSEFREFVYVNDVSRVVSRLINSDYSGVVNLVSGRSYTY